MNIIEKIMASVRDWTEFYLNNSTASEKTKNKIISFIDYICKVKLDDQ